MHVIGKEFGRKVIMDDSGGILFGDSSYDWVSAHGHRTPRDYPYSHDEFYLWRDFDKDKPPRGLDCYYTDRMRGWDYEKYKKAAGNRMENFGSVPRNRKAAQEFVDIYFGREFECVGIIQSMNVSTGYPLGVFCIKRREA